MPMLMLMDHGFSASSSSLGIGLIGLVAIFGTVALGRMADRVSRRKLLALIYSIRGLSFFALVLVGAHFELYLAASIGGLVWAGSIALSSAILADVYGAPRWRAVRLGLRGPPTRRDGQLMAGRLGLRNLRHALGGLWRRRHLAAAGHRDLAALAGEGLHPNGAKASGSVVTADTCNAVPHRLAGLTLGQRQRQTLLRLNGRPGEGTLHRAARKARTLLGIEA
jgi:hypothetical protein